MATQPRLAADAADGKARAGRTFSRLLVLALGMSALVWLIAAPTTRASGGSGYAITGQSYVEIPANSTLKPAAVCVEAWVKIEAHLGGNQYIVYTQNTRFPHYVEGYTLYAGGAEGSGPWFAVTVSSKEGQQVSVVSNAPVDLGRWYHLAMLADGEALALYVNGELQGVANTGFALDYGDEPIYIGYDGINADGRVYGTIDEVRIWDTTLDAAALRQWMHREVTGAHQNYDNLRGYWKLNEGSGNTVYDTSGNHINGMLYGDAPWVLSQAPINNLTTHRHEIAALWDNRPSTATDDFASGLDIADVDFLTDVGDDIVFGHNNAAFARVSSDLPDGIYQRWVRVWELAVTQIWPTTQYVDLTFDISDAGGQGSFSEAGSYFLLRRPAGSSDAFTTVAVLSSSVAGDQVTLRVDVTNLGSEFTLGMTDQPPLTIVTRNVAVTTLAPALPVAALLAIGLVGVVSLRLRRRV